MAIFTEDMIALCAYAPESAFFDANSPLWAAITLAGRAHQGQKDKAGDPYFWHVLRVGASLLPDLDAAIVGLLHDVLEDTSFPLRTLWALFPRQAAAVELLTRSPQQPYHVYLADLARSPLARKVKLADIRDNLNPDRLTRAAANGADVARLATKYTHALNVLQPSSEEVQ